ncbi:hypothetical protein MKW94_024463 [Papaver nudicaule]|uniref:Uncharacterized protein n=1 Tax=Papaver nudicaule TaxID=74823 RepID=A0AA42AZI2_PAPNU|nr:hypothetical protein [Papaver nudicaule]
MAEFFRSLSILAIPVFFFFFSSHLVEYSCAEKYLFVQGKVYCDTCRAAFETELTEYIDGAKVRLECHDIEGGHLTYSIEGVTNSTGVYRLPVQGDHAEEICEVYLVKSPLPDCSEILKGGASARVQITSNNGIADDTRYANSLGFLKTEPVDGCVNTLRDMGLPKEAMVPESKN